MSGERHWESYSYLRGKTADPVTLVRGLDKRTVIIHGKRVSDLSPRHGRPECDLWGVTRGNDHFWGEQLVDWTEWYDVHPLVPMGPFAGIPERRPATWDWYKKQDGTRPIYLMRPTSPREQDLFNQVPGAVPFPIEDLMDGFPIAGAPCTWFLCQVGMMIAKAIFNEYERIILNGVGVSFRVDFQHIHRDTLYWIAFARGIGIDVVVEGPSTYHAPQQIYAYGKLSYDDLAAARLEAAGPSLEDLLELEQRDARERARGRPSRRKVRV